MNNYTSRFAVTVIVPVLCFFLIAPIPCCFYTVRFSDKDTHWVRASDIRKLTETEIEFTTPITRQTVKGTHFSIIEPIIPSFRKER